MSNQEPIYLLPQYIENCFDSITGNLKVNQVYFLKGKIKTNLTSSSNNLFFARENKCHLNNR